MNDMLIKLGKIVATSLLFLFLTACGESDPEIDSPPAETNNNILTTTIIGNGSLVIQSDTLNCNDICEFTFEEIREVEVEANPDDGFLFDGFSGACEGIIICNVSMSEAREVSANFIAIPIDIIKHKLTTNVGDGGTLSIEPNSLTCTNECKFEFDENTSVNIISVANDGFVFDEFSGACEGIIICNVSMSEARQVSVNFTAIPINIIKHKLTTNVGDGGALSIEPNSLTCSNECEFEFDENSSVNIITIANDGFVFSGFGGACEGIIICNVSMSEARQVSANFTAIPIEVIKHKLTAYVGDGGTLRVEPNSLTCIDECEFEFDENTSVNIIPVANDGFVFDGFSGSCSGADTECTIAMSEAMIVSATFTSLSCPDRANLKTLHFDNEYAKHDPLGITDEVLLTDFVVKNSSGIDTNSYPVSMIFPLEQGKYFHHGDFHIKDADGKVVPAQFNVLNRWWAKDKSLRHIQAHFTVSLDAYVVGKVETGVKSFNLYSGNLNVMPVNPVCATEDRTDIKLTNGLTTINIAKNPLVITTPAGQLKSLFTKENGDIDESFNHDDITFELEEVGAQRSVLKISSLANHVSPTDIKHGWAMRIYLSADSTKVKVDFQLQNSALNVDYSAPLYFKSHELVLDVVGDTLTQYLKSEMIDEDKINSGESGSIATPNVNVYFRDFWQRFPLGLSTTNTGKLSVEFYPSWSKQFLDKEYATIEMYWLDDMTASYQELIFDFTKDEISDSVVTNFQSPPVPVIPQAYYQKTSVTLELGGFFPLLTPPAETNRILKYGTNDFTPLNSAHALNFGQGNYGLDSGRKRATNQTGGVPYSVRKFFISGNPRDYYSSQKLASAELNIRPQWLSGYTHNNHFELIQPTANPYGGNSWRDFRGHYKATLSREYIEGSSRIAHPRDDQHAWFYHMEQAYLQSGNKWIKDWFMFMAEYKMAYLQSLDPWPDRSNRSEGHNVSVAVSAYRVTGNKQLGDLLENYIVDEHQKYVLAPHYISIGKITTKGSAAAFQQGFLMRSFIELYYEFPNQERTVELIGNAVNWNIDYSNYSYYRSIFDHVISPSASGTGLSFVDVATWYSMQTNELKYVDHAITYVDVGIGGVKPYYFYGKWSGGYAGQLYYYYLQTLNTE